MSRPLPNGWGFAYGARRMKPGAWLERHLGDEDGQGMTEYLIAAMVAMIPLITLLLPTMIAVGVYVRGIYSWVGLPFP